MTQRDERALIQAARGVASDAVLSARGGRVLAQTEEPVDGATFETLVSISRTGALSASAAPQVASFPVPLAKKGDLVFVHRDGKPTNGPSSAPVILAGGVLVESHGYVPSDGVVEVYYSIPTIVVSKGSVLTIPLRLRGFRAG